ncbi:MAG: hypothetical protein DRR42_14765 [Gammaproteobacteria bacterium]|nr:MAG: hypothetical protein DRR42_14765 [Gammaproteobacteria bacterium]
MKKTIKKTIFGCLLLSSFSSNATVINFIAEGTGNIAKDWNESLNEDAFVTDAAANFFKVIFSSGSLNETITQVQIDLRAGSDTNAYFDPSDGYSDSSINSNGGGMGFGPLIGNATNGLVSSDVVFSLNKLSGVSPILEINFLNDSFNVGDVFSFGIDIDELDGDNEDLAGGRLGLRSVGVSAQIAGGCEDVGASNFRKEARNRSSANIAFCGATVPEPGTWLLLLFGPLLIKLSSQLQSKKSYFKS